MAASSEVEPFTPIENFEKILTKPDNIPIVIMIGLLLFFTLLSLREARKHDRLIREGRKSEILKAMQD